MKKTRRKLTTMRSRHIRLTDSIWQKLAWFAEEKGLQLADALRVLIGDALKNQKPPESEKLLAPKGTAAEWERWELAAKHRNQSVDDLTRAALNYAAGKLLDKNA